MAYPFNTEIMRCTPISTTSLRFGLTTLASHATAVDLRVKLYSDSGRSSLVATGSTGSSSGGSVRERVVSTVTGLTAGTKYYPVVEYREVTGVDPWVTITSLSSDCDYMTLPSSGTFYLDWYTDPHLTVANMTSSDGKHENFMAECLTNDAPLLFCGGDLRFEATETNEDWHLARIAFEEDLLRHRPMITALGNWEFRTDPTNSDLFPNGYDQAYFEGVDADDLAFFLNPDADSARETYGCIDCGMARLIWVESFTGSGIQYDNGAVYDTFLDSTQWAYLLDKISTNTKPWLLIHTHTPLTNTLYNRPRGYLIPQDDSQEEALQAAIVAHRKANSALRGCIRMLGHNHRFHHWRYQGIEYVDIGSTRFSFTYSNLGVGLGYTSSDCLFVEDADQGDVGYARLALTSTGGTLDFIRTTTTPTGATADSTIVYSATLPNIQDTETVEHGRGSSLKGHKSHG